MKHRTRQAFVVVVMVFCGSMTLVAAEGEQAAGKTSWAKRNRTYTPRPFQVVSPEVHPDRRITFRLRAPQANAVEVKSLFFKGKEPLRKDDKGVWSVTLGPAEPGIQSYTFFVDGLEVTDPANPWIIFSPKSAYNLLEVPADEPLCFQRQNVPCGTVHIHSYYSRDLKATRSFLVYTPPGYETSGRDDYPVLYLLHGGGNHERSWTNNGRAHIIADNLLAKGKATPMVIAMPYGHLHSNRQYREYEPFQRTLLEEVLPLVETTYRVSKNRKDRAIAGLSMGGAQSLYVGLCNLDQFGWIGAFSAAIPDTMDIRQSSGKSAEDQRGTQPAVDRLRYKRFSLQTKQRVPYQARDQQDRAYHSHRRRHPRMGRLAILSE